MSQKQPVGMAVAKFDYKTNDSHELNITKGEKLTLLDDSQHWWQVMNSKGETGYVPSNFCKKSKQSLFSSLRNTLGRKKNKEPVQAISCGSSSVGTAPSSAGGRRSATASPKTINQTSEPTNDNEKNHINDQKLNDSNISQSVNANPFYGVGSLKSNGSSAQIIVSSQNNQSVSYNLGHQNQSQPVFSNQINQCAMQKVSNDSQLINQLQNQGSVNVQFNGREYFGSGGGLDSHRFHQEPGVFGPPQTCVAKFSYTPCQPDELALNRGDRIKVLEKSSDGWWRGELINNTSLLATGWFPSNYVTLERLQTTNTFRSATDSLGRQLHTSGMGTTGQHHSSMPSVTAGMEAAAVIGNHHGGGNGMMTEVSWSGSNKVSAMQRYSTVLTLYPFTKNQPEEMSFEANEILEVMERPLDDPDWWRCRNASGDTGLVPKNYVKLLTSATEAIKGIAFNQQPNQKVDQKKFLSTTNSDADSMRHTYNKSGRFRDRIWYWGAISRLECESLLMSNGYLGQFVVRDSESHPGDLTITMHAGTKCRNFKVHIENNEFHIGQKVFNTIESLIQHYRTHPIYKSDTERLFLTDPFQYKTPLSSF